MNRYAPSRHRPAFTLIAFAMAALTLLVAVVAPTRSAPAGAATSAMEAATGPTEVFISPSRLDIVAVREPKVAADDARVAPAKRRHSS